MPLPAIVSDIIILNNFNQIIMPTHKIFKSSESTVSYPDYIIKSYTWLKIIAILMLVIYFALIIISIVLAFKNLNILKSKIYVKISYVLMFMLLTTLIGLILASLNYCKYLDTYLISNFKLFKVKSTSHIGIYQYLIITISSVLIIFNIAINSIKQKK